MDTVAILGEIHELAKPRTHSLHPKIAARLHIWIQSGLTLTEKEKILSTHLRGPPGNPSIKPRSAAVVSEITSVRDGHFIAS